MVTARGAAPVAVGRDRRGASTVGCLVTLLIFAAVCYYGFFIGRVYWKYNELQAEMESQARLAPSLTDGVIRRRLVAVVDDLLLPPEAERFVITRSGRPRKITIETEYRETVDLPLFKHEFKLHPTAEEPI
jgi:hypothetical protein